MTESEAKEEVMPDGYEKLAASDSTATCKHLVVQLGPFLWHGCVLCGEPIA